MYDLTAEKYRAYRDFIEKYIILEAQSNQFFIIFSCLGLRGRMILRYSILPFCNRKRYLTTRSPFIGSEAAAAAVENSRILQVSEAEQWAAVGMAQNYGLQGFVILIGFKLLENL